MISQGEKRSFIKRLALTLGWTRSSSYLMSAFLLIIFLITYIWWPLAEEYISYIPWDGEWWRYIDWLLIGIFLVMSLLIMAGADLRADALIVFVGFVGGLVIESWGTQTEIWTYYTDERPPLWIIPAWPIASLSIDRLTLFSNKLLSNFTAKTPSSQRNSIINLCVLRVFAVNYKIIYWLIFPAFYTLMLSFVWPTVDKSLTIMALVLVGFLTLTPTNHRTAVLTFIAGSGLGYFLERWGTTRLCWTYYTLETPPLFAVLAHGMAAVAFWRTALVLDMMWRKITGRTKQSKQPHWSSLSDPMD
ncbi:MAG: hypothetical protein ISS57_10680 [Anaerolineales bacterium]|nr:hypothetical protein [Chloroflexota bacterium]MBL7163062.1 hypothetical protein [Anaerolineales bacterium]